MTKPKEIKHFEIKEYEHLGISVLVSIDHDKEHVSLIERNHSPNAQNGTGVCKPKPWIFAKREIEYQAGWHNILEATKYAIDEAFKDLKKTLDRKERESVALIRAAQKEEL